MSTRYQVLITPHAQHQIKKLDPSALAPVMECLDGLRMNARPVGVEKLNQDPKFWRLKAGKYRVVYTILDDRRAVIIALVSPRREVYREVYDLDFRAVIATALPSQGGPQSSSARH